MTTTSIFPSNDPIHFVVIGCGMFARSRHIPNLATSSRTKLTGLCDLDVANLRSLQTQYNVPMIFSDWRDAVRHPQIQAICLATTEKLRLPVIQLAAELGKPVYVEKPLAKELDEMYEIQKVVKSSGIPMCVGHNRRRSPAMLEAHRIFRQHMEQPNPNPWRWAREGKDRMNLPDDGLPAISVRINDDWWSWKNWVFDKAQAPHGALLFEMTHFTDMCNWLLAAKPIEVFATETGMLTHSVVIRYDNGSLATIASSANGSFSYGKELYECMGNGGFLTVDHLLEIRTAGIPGAPEKITFPMIGDRDPEIGKEGGISGWLAKKRAACAEAEKTGDLMRQFTAEPDRGHAHMLDAFADQLRGEGDVVATVDDAVLATRIAFAAVKSSHERRIVKIDEV